MKIFIGIDPGASGGIGYLFPDGTQDACPFAKLTDTDIIDQLSRNNPDAQYFAYIEQVHSMPKQGVASSFKFGEHYGKLQMALIAARIPFERVTPQKWQRALGCMTKGDKNVSKRRAQELFPAMKITHAIADALLIAEYGRRAFKE